MVSRTARLVTLPWGSRTLGGWRRLLPANGREGNAHALLARATKSRAITVRIRATSTLIDASSSRIARSAHQLLTVFPMAWTDHRLTRYACPRAIAIIVRRARVVIATRRPAELRLVLPEREHRRSAEQADGNDVQRVNISVGFPGFLVHAVSTAGLLHRV